MSRLEIKDWVTLFVPIISNGLLLFVFQQAILQGNKRIDRRNDYQYQTLSHFLELLQKFYEAFRNIQDVDETRSGKRASFASVWNPTAELMKQLIVYSDTHPVATKKVNIQFQKCKEKWDQMVEQLLTARHEHDEVLSGEENKKFNENYVRMDSLIRECLKRCEIEILKL